ncbi:hypothetical protein [Microcystis phage Mel-JY01]
MKNENKNDFVSDTEYVINELKKMFKETARINEGAIDDLFLELKKKLPKIIMLPNDGINASQYQEHEIVDALRVSGFEYKKPMGKKLHFFNKKTSISVYLSQTNKQIFMQP